MLQTLGTTTHVEQNVRRFRKPLFKFKPKKTQRDFAPGSLRQTVLNMLRSGALFEDVEDVVREFKTGRARPKGEKQNYYRTYSIIRIMNTQGGWGIEKGEDNRLYVVGGTSRK